MNIENDPFFEAATAAGRYFHQALDQIGEAGRGVRAEEARLNEDARQHVRKHLWLAQRQFEIYANRSDAQFTDAALHLTGRLVEGRLSMRPGITKREICEVAASLGAEVGGVVAEIASAS